jgi:hypothetical protein
MREVNLNFEFLEDRKTHNLYMAIEDVLMVLRYFQEHVDEFMDSDFTFIKQKKEELN